MPNTAKISLTQAEIDEAREELYAALLPPSDIRDCKPWETLDKEVRERYGFFAEEGE